jgi:hypothetical protein
MQQQKKNDILLNRSNFELIYTLFCCCYNNTEVKFDQMEYIVLLRF